MFHQNDEKWALHHQQCLGKADLNVSSTLAVLEAPKRPSSSGKLEKPNLEVRKSQLLLTLLIVKSTIGSWYAIAVLCIINGMLQLDGSSRNGFLLEPLWDKQKHIPIF